MLDIIIQVILAIFLLLIMAFIAYSVYDTEYIKNIKLTNSNKHETLILNGIYSFDKTTSKVETFNKLDPNYFDLNPSVNQNGGAEYSYNFWLYYNIMDTGSDQIIRNQDKNKYIILFFKGDLNTLTYNQAKYSRDTEGLKKYLIVKNPLVKLSNDGRDIIVEYNNINHPDTFNSSSKPLKGSATNIKNFKDNKLGIKDIDNQIYNKTWNMVTIVMQENPQQEDELFVNRTNCKVYFNGTLISDRSTLNNNLTNENSTDMYSTVMKKNQGNLYVNPNLKLIEKGLSSEHYVNRQITEQVDNDEITKDIPVKMANLAYYNYALSQDEILKLYKKKFPIKEVVLVTSTIDKNKVRIGDRINFDMYDGEKELAIPVKSI